MKELHIYSSNEKITPSVFGSHKHGALCPLRFQETRVQKRALSKGVSLIPVTLPTELKE
jgi:hypothetical protein